MRFPSTFSDTRRSVEHALLSPEAAAALRSALALAIAWTLFHWLGQAEAGMIAATTAQNVALLQVRGDYWSRVVILCVLIVTMAVWAFVGTVAGPGVWVPTLLAGVLALAAGGWRHASTDFGPQFALASALMFFIALAHPDDASHAPLLVVAAVGGGGIGLLLQLSGWFFRPQHALRHAASETFVAVSDLASVLRDEACIQESHTKAFSEKEFALRATLDRSFRAIQAASHGRSVLPSHLAEVCHLAARLGTRITALHSTLEPLRGQAAFAELAPSLDTIWRTLVNLSRSAALTILHHRQDHFAAFTLRVQRATDLLKVLAQQVRALEVAAAEKERVEEALSQLSGYLPDLRAGLEQTVDQGGQRSLTMPRLPDLGQRSSKALGAWLSPATQLDSVIVRYSLRAALLLMGAIAAYRYFDIPRGYWIAFTILVVLQPDFGATRQKAGQRIVGTVAGSIIGSLLLWIKLPAPALVACSSVLAFGFAYNVRRRYSLAVFFVTLMIVLMTESVMPVHLDFTIARTLATLLGGGLAMAAAFFFWPSWNEERSPRALAAALRANRIYLERIGERLVSGGAFADVLIEAKREAERANSRATASWQRRLAHPTNLRGHFATIEVLTAYNPRLTRAITLLGQQLNRGAHCPGPSLVAAIASLAGDIEALSVGLESGVSANPGAGQARVVPKVGDDRVHGELVRIGTEVDAMKRAMAGTG